MSRTLMTFANCVFKVADTEAGLTTGVEYQCQLTSAALVATSGTNSIPGNGCGDGPSNVLLSATWDVALNVMQDWNGPGGGLCMYAFDNELAFKWFSLEDDSGDAIATGQAQVAPFQFGGEFGGVPVQASATWPMQSKPAFTVPVAVAGTATQAPPADGTPTTQADGTYAAAV